MRRWPCSRQRPRPLSAYFRQRFAQVTNPPIDSLRERIVLSLDTFIGARGNLLVESEEKAELIRLQSVVITESQLNRIKKLCSRHLCSTTISTVFDLNATDLPTALDQRARASRGSDPGWQDDRRPFRSWS